MELKMFDSKLISVSKSLGSSNGLFLRSKKMVGLNFFPQLCCCRGNIPNFTYSNTSEEGDQGKLRINSYSYQINGTNGAARSIYFEDIQVLEAFDDEYGGVIINADKLPSNPHVFASNLRSSLSHWKIKGKEGVWLKLPLEKSEHVPIAVKEGFEYHHAERGYVMLTLWLPEGPCMLPANASHQVGVGGFVINDKNEVLVVQEKHCSPELYGLWKLPTGFIHESEEIFNGAVREVKEETGVRTSYLIHFLVRHVGYLIRYGNGLGPATCMQVDTEFIEVVAFRHAHNVAFKKSDLFFICMLRPLSTQILVDNLEVQAAKWMPLMEFIEQPLIRGDSMFKKVMDICIARLGKRYCGLSVHKVVSKFDGRLSSLYYNVVEDKDFNCRA